MSRPTMVSTRCSTSSTRTPENGNAAATQDRTWWRRDSALLQDERHDLVGQHVHGSRGRYDILDPCRARQADDGHGLEQRLRAHAEERAVGPAPRHVARCAPSVAGRMPRRWAHRPGATRSRSPTSIPNSMVDVHTMAVFWPWENRSSASMRSARLTELWWMNTSTPDPARAWATFSARGPALPRRPGSSCPGQPSR